MNQHLKTILKFIEQSGQLSADEKKSAVQEVNAAERELETKHRDLEIESSLERVRAVALSMKQPNDLLSISKVMFEELQSLGFSDLRNGLIATFDDEKAYVRDYDYSDYSGGSSTRIPYNTNPIIDKFRKEIKSAPDAFVAFTISENELNKWKEYRRSNGESDDPRLENISALYYYFYSIGIAAIGISTFSALTEENLNVLKRFRNVFDLAYRRYMDVALAEAQAHEAKIEASLERVRAFALGMRKPDDLLNTCTSLFIELQSLGFTEMRNAMINIHNDEKGTFVNYDYSDDLGKTINHLSYNIHPVIENQIKKIRSASDAFSETVFKGKELDDWKQFRKDVGEPDDPRVDETSSLHYYLYSIGNGSIGISSFSSLPEETRELLKRFRNVFDLAYKRYTDIALAEAQAREAQIELSLERVRAKAMAMQKSADVNDAVSVVFEELEKLNLGTLRCGIGILNKEKRTAEVWTTSVSDQGKTLQVSGDESIDIHPLLRGAYEAWLKQEEFSYDLKGDDLVAYYRALGKTNFKLPQASSIAEQAQAQQMQQFYFVAQFEAGNLFAFNEKEFSDEAKKVIRRFASVFNLTYKRFLDLQKAEAQAREAQIELALERVRARTMAMQKSDELSETAEVLFNQFNDLGAAPIQITIGIFNDEEGVIEFRSTDPLGSGAKVDYAVKGSLEEPTLLKKIYADWREGKKSTVIALEGKELSEWVKYRINMSGVADKRDYSDQRRVVYVGFFSKGMLSVSAIDDPSRESVQLLERFAGVFDLTYTRFLDLKQAEAQAREAQIEAALERVRSRTMGMQKSEELQEVIQVVYQQFAHLNINIGHTGFVMDYKARDDYAIWIADPLGVPSQVTIPYFDSVYYNRFNEAKEKGEDFFATNLSFEEKNKFYQKLFEYVPGLPEKSKEFYFNCPGLAISTVLLENIGLYIENFSGTPYTDEENATLMRFGKVFQQTYTRFLDLQKAEAQARESQIELALERVRARTMAMQHSEELLEVINVISSQLQDLNIKFHFVSFGVNSQNSDFDFWLASPAFSYPERIHMPSIDNPISNTVIEAQKEGLNFFANIFSRKENREWLEVLLKNNETTQISDEGRIYLLNSPGFARSAVMLKNINIFLGNYIPKPYSNEQNDVLIRFANVFEQAYTRFLDLQKAEEQIREAKIEAALERTRTQSMIMQHSKELDDTLRVFHEQVLLLGIHSAFSFLWLPDEEKDRHIFWAAWAENLPTGHFEKNDSTVFKSKAINYPLDRNEPATAQCLVDWKGNDPIVSYHVPPSGVENYFAAWQELIAGVEQLKPEYFTGGLYYVEAFMKYGCFGVMIKNPLPEEEKKILARFAVEFERAYTRFLDLQKAEMQAREAQIETALERVRARTMAMQNSNELKNAAALLFQQVKALGVPAYSCGYNIWEKDEKEFTSWMSTQDGSIINGVPNIPLTEDANFMRYVESKQKGEPFFVLELRGERMQEHYEYLKTIPAFKAYFDYAVSVGFDLPETQIHHLANFSHGNLLFITLEPCPEFHDVFKRFGAVFEQTYTRFLDLQKAEAQAREAKIEASLERVRSRAMAMHESSHLTEAAGALFTELNKLGINPIRSGFVLLTKESRRAKLYPATSLDKENTVSYTGEFEFIGHPVYEKQYESWQKKENYFPVLEGEVLKSYYRILSEALSVSFDQFKETDKQFGCFLPFSEGFLFTWSVEPYSKDEINILDRFKSILDLTIRRYLDLQKAEAQTREAQIEAALEKVRSSALAMHKSEDFQSTSLIVFNVLKTLGVHPVRSGLSVLLNESKMEWEAWSATLGPDGNVIPASAKFTSDVHWVSKEIFERWKKQDPYWQIDLSGDDLKSFVKGMPRKYVPADESKSSLPTQIDRIVFHYFSFPKGVVFAGAEHPFSEEEISIMKRFTRVFAFAYTRYLDLQQAEQQAREAQIEAGLERVRSRTLAMHSSDELAETAAVVFKQLINLGIEPNRLYIALIKDESGDVEFWITDEDGSKVSSGFHANLNDNPTFLKMFAGWKEQKKSITIDMQGEELQEYFRHLTSLNVPFKGGRSQTRRVQNIAYFSQGFIGIASPDSQPEETDRLLERFASVFNLTYTRFNDLQLAEAQAKKAQMEAAMERVRGRALAMQQPEELLDVAVVLRHEMGLLGVEEIETGTVFIFDDAAETAQFGFTAKDPTDPEKGTVTDTVTMDLNQTWAGKEFLKFFRSAENQLSLRMEGEQRSEWIKYLYSLSAKANNFFGENIRDRTYHLFKYSNGAVAAVANGDITEDSWDLLKRSASVFTLAYSRFKDLTKARIDLINLKEEKKRSDSLLLNILPQEIADELKQFGKSYARKHDEVTILFADIKGFSSIAETLSAQELVTQLDECFRAFDHIVDKHGLEKIKTVGDAYVCACGLPLPVADHAAKAVRAAIDMMNFIKGFSITRTIQDLPAFEFRIGINTGSVVTGVVGLKKFTYDIWGDAVNMAARMEQHGEAGKINISESTHALIKDKFACTSRGKIAAKNKGEVEMYFVES